MNWPRLKYQALKIVLQVAGCLLAFLVGFVWMQTVKVLFPDVSSLVSDIYPTFLTIALGLVIMLGIVYVVYKSTKNMWMPILFWLIRVALPFIALYAFLNFTGRMLKDKTDITNALIQKVSQPEFVTFSVIGVVAIAAVLIFYYVLYKRILASYSSKLGGGIAVD